MDEASMAAAGMDGASTDAASMDGGLRMGLVFMG
jgi:hypothetical protein